MNTKGVFVHSKCYERLVCSWTSNATQRPIWDHIPLRFYQSNFINPLIKFYDKFNAQSQILWIWLVCDLWAENWSSEDPSWLVRKVILHQMIPSRQNLDVEVSSPHLMVGTTSWHEALVLEASSVWASFADCQSALGPSLKVSKKW